MLFTILYQYLREMNFVIFGCEIQIADLNCSKLNTV